MVRRVAIIFFFPSTAAIVNLIFSCIAHYYHLSAQCPLSLLDQPRQPVLNPIHLGLSSVLKRNLRCKTHMIIAIILSGIRLDRCVTTRSYAFRTWGSLRPKGANSPYFLPTTMDNLSTWRCYCGARKWSGCRYNGMGYGCPFTFLIGWWRWKLMGRSIFRVRTGICGFDSVSLFVTTSPTWG